MNTFRVSLGLAAIAASQTVDPLSREGEDLSMVIMINSPALCSPVKILNLAVNPEDEALWQDRISPMGQRQQFLIGSELRKRYVDEAKLMTSDYVVSETYLQTPFDSKNILSMQAQMMGFFPASNANDLTEWQQGNAVPPIKGADFTKWQGELGAAALPYGLNTFPIQQMGPEADVILSMNPMNCQRYGKAIDPLLYDAESQLAQSMTTNYQDAWKQMLDKDISGPEMCSYLDWAYYARVTLQGNMDEWQEIHSTVCKTYANAVTQSNITVEWSNDGMVSNSFNSKLLKILKQGYARESQNIQAHLAVFFNFQTLTPDILSTIALSTANKPNTPSNLESLPASSSIVFEVKKDGTIRGFLNDEEYTLGGCADGVACQRSDFEAHLMDNVSKIPNITDYCKNTDLDTQILN